MKRLLILVIVALVFAPVGARAQWYLTGSPGPLAFAISGNTFIAGTYHGVYLSRDSGLTWTYSNPNLDSVRINTFLQEGRSIYAGTSNGVYVSSDDGVEWEKTGDDLSDNVICITSIGTLLFVLTADSGLYRSADSGISWRQVNSGLPVHTLEALTASDKALFLGSWKAGIFKSIDSGQTWIASNGNLKNGLTFTTLFENNDTLYAGVIDSGYVSSTEGIFVSPDNGASWHQITTDWGNAICKIGSHILVGGDYGVNLSTDNGKTWRGITLRQYQGATLFYVHGTSIYASNDASDLVLSGDSGVTWKFLKYTQCFNTIPPPLVLSGTKLVVGSNGSEGLAPAIYSSTDSGVTWTASDSGMPQTNLNYFLHFPIYALAANGSDVFAATDSGIYVSTNSAVSWRVSHQRPCDKIQSLVAIGTNIFAGGISYVTPPNQDPRYGIRSYLVVSGVFRSTDRGGSWKEIVNLIADSIWNVSIASTGNTLIMGREYSTDLGDSWISDSIVPVPGLNEGASIFGECKGIVFLSSNDGVDWSEIALNYPGNYTGISISYKNTLFIAHSDTITAINSDGTSHTTIFYAGTNTSIVSLFVADGYLYLVTGGPICYYALWRRHLSELIPQPNAVHNSEAVSNSLTAYPNPTEDWLTIEGTTGALSIWDALGRAQQCTMVSGKLHVAGLPAGVYYIGDGRSRAKFVKE